MNDRFYGEYRSNGENYTKDEYGKFSGSTSGGGSGKNVLDKSAESGIIKPTGKVYSFEEYNENPLLLGESTHKEKYDFYMHNSYDVLPLGNGNFKNVDYEKGGGYVVRFSDKQSILMYHPPKRTHHGFDEYYKLSTGKTGVRRFNMDGTPRKENKK